MTNALLSIKPKYAQAIMNGSKKVEFRKKVFKQPVEKVFVYSSSPEKKIIGYFVINEIVEDSPKNLWKTFKNVGGILKQDFFDYYENHSKGFSIKILEVEKFEKSIDPKEIFDKFTAPQSFLYLEDEVASNIKEQGLEI